MSKWTKWIEYLGDDLPVPPRETVKLDVSDGIWIGEAEFGDWASASHYKRLKDNVNQEMSQADKDRQELESVEATEKLIALCPDDLESAPVITGPGEYKTRDGRKATVTQYLERAGNDFKWFGKIELENSSRTWIVNGFYYGEQKPDPRDITGPWVEPEHKPEELEMFVNVYQTSTGSLYPGQIHDNFTEAQANGKSHTALGTFKLVKVEGW